MSRDLPNIGATHFPHIPAESWRDDAACARNDDITLWDASVGKSARGGAAEARKHRAKAICDNVCSVRKQCGDAVDWRFDEGIRAGHELPPLNATSASMTSARDQELRRLLKAGWPLDDAAAAASRFVRKVS